MTGHKLDFGPDLSIRPGIGQAGGGHAFGGQAMRCAARQPSDADTVGHLQTDAVQFGTGGADLV
jgi:hypothetical protein